MLRFWDKVDQSGGPESCWLWTATLINDGYGHFWYEDRLQLVHRVAWKLCNGAIPDDLKVLHSCDVRNCVNPDHLFLGTNVDNMRDMVDKGRQVSPLVPGNPKLTEDDVRSIRKLREAGCLLSDLSQMYSISEASVSLIARRINWAHVS